MDDAIVSALNSIREEFRKQNVQTEGAVNQGFIAIRTEMRLGLDRFNDRVEAKLLSISDKMEAHEKEYNLVEKRLSKMELEKVQDQKLAAEAKLEERNNLQRYGAKIALIVSVGIDGASKLLDIFLR